jgi:2-amino-4-hydroxy-6-hydroxymethyldihydropteridine diphosphokinase
MFKVYLGLGSNIGNRQDYINQAIGKLSQKVIVKRESNIYESEPWGESDQDLFLNMCIEIETNLEPNELYELILKIETELNKQKTTKYGPRTIDIDILIYSPTARDHSPLIIPHPRLTQRNFVLSPLSEIAPDLIHPVDNKTISELQSICNDKSKVKIWTPND